VHKVQSLRVGDDEEELVGIDGRSGALNLRPLLVGSEGMLGVVVEITVALKVVPPRVETLLCSFASVESASDAVAAIIAAGITPAGMEMMDKLALTAAEDFARAGYPGDAEAILLVELDGCDSEVEADLRTTREALRKSGVGAVRLAAGAGERESFWRGRKSALPAVGRLAPDYYCMDGTIPRGAIAEVLKWIGATSAQFDMPVANVFHAGDGNLHPLILFDANRPGELEKAERFGGLIPHPGLDPRPPVGHIDLQNAVHPAQYQHHPPRAGPGTPGETGAGAAGDHRHAQPSTEPHDGPHLPHRFRQHGKQR